MNLGNGTSIVNYPRTDIPCAILHPFILATHGQGDLQGPLCSVGAKYPLALAVHESLVLDSVSSPVASPIRAPSSCGCTNVPLAPARAAALNLREASALAPGLRAALVRGAAPRDGPRGVAGRQSEWPSTRPLPLARGRAERLTVVVFPHVEPPNTQSAPTPRAKRSASRAPPARRAADASKPERPLAGSRELPKLQIVATT